MHGPNEAGFVRTDDSGSGHQRTVGFGRVGRRSFVADGSVRGAHGRRRQRNGEEWRSSVDGRYGAHSPEEDGRRRRSRHQPAAGGLGV